EAELLIVVGTDPLASIERALLERRIYVATGDLLRDAAKLRQNAPSPTADPHLETLEIVEGVDLLAEPTAHLAAGVTGEQRMGVVFLVELVQHVAAAAVRPPGLVDARVGTERHGSAEAEGRI